MIKWTGFEWKKVKVPQKSRLNRNTLESRINIPLRLLIFWLFSSLWHHGGCQRLFPFLWYEWYLTTITVELGFLGKFVLLSLKTCSLYHENLSIQKFKVISSQVLNNFFSASDIMEAVRGHFCFYRYECKVAWYKLDCCEVCMLRINRNKHYNHSLEENGRRPLISSLFYKQSVEIHFDSIVLSFEVYLCTLG